MSGRSVLSRRAHRVQVVLTFLSLALTLGATPACDAPSPPEIGIDISPVNVGIRSTDPDLPPLHFDLQLFNRGEEVLVISGLEVHGDENCAFSFEGPDRSQLGYGESAFIRGWYQPTVVAEDHIALYITSNSVVNPVLVVPVWGKWVPPGTEEASEPVCVVPGEDQGDCEEPD